jgi:hypothetical protein
VFLFFVLLSGLPSIKSGQAQSGDDPRYDEVCWLAGHNAFANAEQDYKINSANQLLSVGHQLNFGARCLLEDIYLIRQKSDALGFPQHRTYTSLGEANDETDDDWEDVPVRVVVAHKPDDPQGGYRLLSGYPVSHPFFREFRDDMALIHAWLNAHPTEIVTIILESNFSEPGFLIQQALQGVYNAGLVFLADRPNPGFIAPDGLAWEVKRHGWPRTSDMVAHNKRLVILSNKRNDGNGYQWDYMVENVFGLDSLRPSTSAQPRAESLPLDNVARPLFFMNYFPTASVLGPNCAGANIPDAFQTNFCENNSTPAINGAVVHNLSVADRLPNYLAVDFLNFGEPDPNATPEIQPLPPSGPVQMTEVINRNWRQQPDLQSMIAVSPGPNAKGFNNTPVTVSFGGSLEEGAIRFVNVSIVGTLNGSRFFDVCELGAPGSEVFVFDDHDGTYQISSFAVGQVARNNRLIWGDVVTRIVQIDRMPPTIDCPSEIIEAARPGECSAKITYPLSAVDEFSGVETTICTPPSGSIFPVGASTVTCDASDKAGNTSQCSFTVTVKDEEKPQIACPANTVAPMPSGQCSAVVNYSPSAASDNCKDATVNCNPASGAVFPKGTTTVICTATDASDNQTSCAFTLTVNDTQPPSLTCPSNLTRATDPNQCNAGVSYPAPAASDNCPGVTAACSPASGSTFPKGTTTVDCIATDASGNSTACSFTVTVNDTQPPAITCPGNLTLITARPGDSSIIVNYPAPTFSDNCPGAALACSSASGTRFPLGVTTVSCAATDSAGNRTTCSFTVTVFDVCLQDDSNRSAVLLFSSQTGDYRFCYGSGSVTGRGTVTRKGDIFTLTDSPSDRRVRAIADASIRRGIASLQSPPGQMRCSITDRDISNNDRACGAGG